VIATITIYRFAEVRRELADAIAETDRLDPGWRFSDLEARRQLPRPEQNAALQVLAVRSQLPRGWWHLPGNRPQEEADVQADLFALPAERQTEDGQVRHLRAALERAGPAVDQARRLADVPEGRYPITWTTDVISTSCPWSDALFSVGPLLQADVLLRNQDGDPDGALVSARSLLNVGRSLGDEPFFNGPAHRLGCRMDAVWAIERTLGQGQPSERALAAVQEAVAGEDAVPLLLAHFRGERAYMHVFLTRVDAGLNRISELNCGPKSALGVHAETWLGRLDALRKHAQYLRGMNEAVEIAKLPLEHQGPLYREWRRRRGHVENVGDGCWVGPREDGFLRCHARLRCTLVALAAERYRRERGDWPRAVADLVPNYLPSAPLDPFGGEPLRYRRSDNGVIVSSAGPERLNDGKDGSPPPQGGFVPRGIMFTLWNIDRRRQPPLPPAKEVDAADRELGARR
jgi:hypothetical protein